MGAVVTGTSDLCSMEDPCRSSGKKPLPPTAPVLGLLSVHSEIGKMIDYMLQIFCHNKKKFFFKQANRSVAKFMPWAIVCQPLV